MMENTDIWALFDDPPAPIYYKGMVCLIGDAAHASTPFQGSGAGMAVEDAYVVSELVGIATDPKSLHNVFETYDKIRRQRTQKLVTSSREAGHLFEFEFEDVMDDIEKLKKKH